jgi:hypothetical protein
MLHLISYVSDFAGDEDNVDHVIGDIVRTAKRENPIRHITGVLFFTQNKFLQVIEGDESRLRQLMHNIKQDERHSNVEYLIDMPINKRGFQQWNMDFFQLSPYKQFNSAIMKELSKSFEEHLLPHSPLLVPYYKSLLEHQM